MNESTKKHCSNPQYFLSPGTCRGLPCKYPWARGTVLRRGRGSNICATFGAEMWKCPTVHLQLQSILNRGLGHIRQSRIEGWHKKGCRKDAILIQPKGQLIVKFFEFEYSSVSRFYNQRMRPKEIANRTSTPVCVGHCPFIIRTL